MHDFLIVLWVIKNITLGIAAVGILFYTLWYFFMSNWRKYDAGRKVLQFVFSLVLVLGSLVFSILDGDTFLRFPLSPDGDDPSIFRILLNFIAYGYVAFTSWSLNRTLIQAWRAGERHPVAPTENPFLPEERTDRARRNPTPRRTK